MARRRFAVCLRRFVTGKTTNFAFEAETDIDSRSDDQTIDALREDLWYSYSDLEEHTLASVRTWSKPARREIARMVLFLKTDRPYEWPRFPRALRLLLLLPNIVTFGSIGWLTQRLLEVGVGGDRGVWPFFRRSDLVQATAQLERRLTG